MARKAEGKWWREKWGARSPNFKETNSLRGLSFKGGSWRTIPIPLLFSHGGEAEEAFSCHAHEIKNVEKSDCGAWKSCPSLLFPLCFSCLGKGAEAEEKTLVSLLGKNPTMQNIPFGEPLFFTVWVTDLLLTFTSQNQPGKAHVGITPSFFNQIFSLSPFIVHTWIHTDHSANIFFLCGKGGSF